MKDFREVFPGEKESLLCFGSCNMYAYRTVREMSGLGRSLLMPVIKVTKKKLKLRWE